ncbi:MAG: hypothetical protein KGI95_27600 [Pseudomonas sp.]|jgi:hypothetical protein|nr:hypothetical protein [Pseudomonas sp.]MDE3072463.1 hypothetical protein [Pseudomonadota bacterium]
MWKHLAVVVLSMAMIAGCAAVATQEASVRIDSSSPQAAEASYETMMKGRSEADRQKLALAVLMINMQGAKSAYDVVNNPDLQSPSIARIREKVAGMTAEQIIELAAKNPSVHMEATGKQGLTSP